jgi:uncharacterized repeat protein (TIGR03803 family)
LHVFKGGKDGSEANGGIIFDASGNLYGTTVSGGGKNSLCYHGCGTVFELSPSSGGWTESVIYRFQAGTDGDAPESALVFDQSGNLYGTALFGGSSDNCDDFGCGVVFELSPKSGGGWTESVLHAFSGADGAYPWAGLIFDATGNLFGTTENGGASGGGVVFELSPAGGKWNQKVLYNFTGGGDGGSPTAKLTFDATGNLYGTTEEGGDSSQCSDGCGTVFKLKLGSGGNWTESVLHTFSGGSGDGANPMADVVFDTEGNLYGVASSGGSANCNGGGCGVVFELSPKSGSWTETILYVFAGASDGRLPAGDLIWDAAGNLYGTTIYGGTLHQLGVVFRFTP